MRLLKFLLPAALILAGTGVAQTRIDLARDVKGTLPPANGGMTAAERAKLDGVQSGATANSSDAQLRDRTTHSGEQPISTVTGLLTALDGKEAAGTAASAVAAHAAAADPHPAYLSAVEGNAAYAPLSHSQAISTVTGLQAALDAKVDDSQVSAYGLTLIDDANASTARTTLGLGSAATAASGDFAAAAHTQAASTITDFSSAADARADGRIAAASVNALADVTVTSPSSGQVLKWNGSAWVNDTDSTGGGGVTDGDKGDISVASGGTAWSIDAGAVTLADQANVASGTLFYRKTAGSGAPEVQSLATLKTDLGLTGTNSGDQTSIAGISGTVAQFNSALTDGDFATGGGTATGTNTGDQTITLSGDASGSGTGALAVTLATVNASPQTDALRKITVNGKGLVTASSAVVAADIPILNQNTTGSAATLTTGRTIGMTGDVSWTSPAFNGSANVTAAGTIANDAVSNAKLANVASGTIKGRITASTGDPEDLTGAQATSLLDNFTSSLKGLVPASGGGTVNFLRADGSWAAPPGGGGGGSPGGADTQVQFNNAGAFGGSANLTFGGGALALNGNLHLTALGSEPSTPGAGTGRLYARDIAGRIVPKWIGPSGVDYVLQSHLGQNNIRMWRAGATTTVATFAAQIGAMPYSAAGTIGNGSMASTNLKTQTQRSTMATGTTAGALTYIRGNLAIVWRGNAPGVGGFVFIKRFGLETLQAGNRAFAGLVDVAANPTNIDPVTTNAPGGIGMAINSNSGNWNLVNNITGTARTALDLGSSFPVNTTDLLELALFCPPQCSAIGYRITNLSSGAQTSGSLATNIPAATTFMAPSLWLTNNATAASAVMNFVSTYVETDF